MVIGSFCCCWFSDDDGDGVPNCYDKCPNGDDSVDLNGNGIPDCAETNGCTAVNDKSPVLDTDGDGIPDKEDACPQEKGLKEFKIFTLF